MIVTLIVIIAAVVVVLTLFGYVPPLLALPAIGVVVAVLMGYLARRRSGSGGP
jgi:hypothetical protein